MTGAVNQMQMAYQPEEDRILFRTNTSDNKEFRFWITRRYSLLLLKILRDHLDRDPDVLSQPSNEAKEAIKDFKQEQAESNVDFSKKFEAEAKDYPLGEEGILAFKLSYTFKEDLLNLSVEPKEGQGISIVINRDLNVSMTRLILAAARQADWKIDQIKQMSAANTGERKVIN